MKNTKMQKKNTEGNQSHPDTYTIPYKTNIRKGFFFLEWTAFTRPHWQNRFYFYSKQKYTRVVHV